MLEILQNSIRIEEFELNQFKEKKINNLNFNKYFILDFCSETGKYYQEEFLNEIWEYLLDYFLSKDELIPLQTGNLNRQKRLEIQEKFSEAVQMYVKRTNTGEVGELILFLILEKILQAPQLVNYMSDSKFSGEKHSEGFDNVHIGIIDDKPVFYIGESKTNECPKKGIYNGFKSVKEIMENRKTENFRFIRNNNLFKDKSEEIKNLVSSYFSPYPKAKDQKLANKVFTFFIGYDFENIEEVIKNKELDSNYNSKIIELEDYINKQKEAFDFKSENCIFFLIPFKKIDALRSDFVKRLMLDIKKNDVE